jgi:hypothetical protein
MAFALAIMFKLQFLAAVFQCLSPSSTDVTVTRERRCVPVTLALHRGLKLNWHLFFAAREGDWRSPLLSDCLSLVFTVVVVGK